ncbi:MAG: DNA primase [Candidatus Dormibacterales bacterium]
MAPAADDVVAQVKSRNDLVEVVAEHVRLRRQSREWVGLCPFHQEDSPSFTVNPQTQVWFCFGCSKGGDLIRFVELIEHTDFKGALQVLADRAGIEISRDRPGLDRRRLELKRRILEVNELAARYYEYVLHSTPAGSPGRELLEARAVGQEAARRFQLGYAPGGRSLVSFLAKKGVSGAEAAAAGLVRSDGRDAFGRRLMVPIRDERGRHLAFTGRTVEAGVRAKYVNSRETAAYVKGSVLFALDLARAAVEGAGFAVVMEGQFDVITAHALGVENAVASSGTALTEDQMRLLKRFTDEVVLAFDADDAGRAAALRTVGLAAAAGLRTRVVAYAGAKDPDEFLRAGPDAPRRWAELVARAVQGWEFKLAAAQRGLNPTNPRDFEVALSRLRADLPTLGDPALQELYRNRAAEWLGVAPGHVEAGPQGGGAGRVKQGSAQPSNGRPAQAAGRRMSPGVYLLQVLAVRPEAASRVRALLRPEDLAEGERPTYLKMLDAIDRDGPEALGGELAEFDETEQELIRRARASAPPPVDDGTVDSVVLQLKRGALEARLTGLRGEIQEAERRGDLRRAEELQAVHAGVGRELEAMKTRRAVATAVGDQGPGTGPGEGS